MKKRENIQKILFATIPGFQPLVKDVDSTRLTQAIGNGNMADILQAAFDTAIVIGAILAVARITYGGFLYMTKDSFTIKGDAKKIITDALIGLVLLLSIVLILKQINPDLLKLDFFVPSGGSDNSIQSAPTSDSGNSQFGGSDPVTSAPAP